MSAPLQTVCVSLPEYAEDAVKNQLVMGPGMNINPGIALAPAPGMVMAPGVTMPSAFNVSVPRTQSRDFLVWSLFNMFYLNVFCLGFIAVAFSVKARDRKVVGDLDGVKHYGNTAKILNIAATTLTLLFCTLMIILLFLGIFSVRYKY
ncbi:dispanin subfamily A member 2b-like isoform X1 [Narcine bancroftii]|uniref:dispanin subfamily A member 2b-like isoform X1 n=1 Tax=Narcine bancroftii TaxID=1343680 RepID=UPI0038319C0E